MYGKFTDRSRKIMQIAVKKAKQRGDFYLGVHHLLMALIEDNSCLAVSVLKKLNANMTKIAADVASSEPACGNNDFIGHVLYTPSAQKAIDEAHQIAQDFGHNYIGTEHLLLGILKTNHSVVTETLYKAGINYDSAHEEIMTLLSHDRKTPPKEEIAISFYHGVLKRIVKTCEENSNNSVQKIEKIAKRAILDGGKWNIS